MAMCCSGHHEPMLWLHVRWLSAGGGCPKEQTDSVMHMWAQVQGRVDIVLFEGWMLGFRPLTTDEVVAVDPRPRACQ